jgi:plasmid stability protein
VPTIYLRDVPVTIVKRLKARAKRNERSLNAELLTILDTVVERDDASAKITRRLEEMAREVYVPPGAPTPEDLIREARDERERRFRR